MRISRGRSTESWRGTRIPEIEEPALRIEFRTSPFPSPEVPVNRHQTKSLSERPPTSGLALRLHPHGWGNNGPSLERRKSNHGESTKVYGLIEPGRSS